MNEGGVLDMPKIIFIAIIAVVMLLVGASVVFAGDAPVESGNRMVQAPVAPGPPGGTDAPDNQTAPQDDGVCPMGGPGPGAMGQGSMMNGEDVQKMHDSMQNGSWEEMRSVCQDAWERNQNSDGGTQPSSAVRGNRQDNTIT